MKAYCVIVTLLSIAAFVGYAKYKVSTRALSYYLIKNKYTAPTDEELKQCTEWVIKNWFRK